MSVRIDISFMFSALINQYAYWYPNTIPYQMMFMPFSNNMTAGNSGADTA